MHETTPTLDCPDCDRRGHGLYDHVHTARELPETFSSDALIIDRGYAVGFSDSRLPKTWIFFEHFEPAYVFGRSARMSSSDVSRYELKRAAREQGYDNDLCREVITLYLEAGSNLRDHENERAILERWIQGCDKRSAYYQPGPK